MNIYRSISKKIHVIIVTILLIITLARCNPLEPGVEAIDSLGNKITALTTEVSQIAEEAGAQGEIVTVTAANQVALVASNLESAFAEDLHVSVREVDQSARNVLAQLEAWRVGLREDVDQVVDSIFSDSLVLINSIPFTNRNPQVKSYTPQFVSTRADSPVRIEITGNFYWATTEDKGLAININGESYKPDELTTTKATFIIPAAAIKSIPDDYSDAVIVLTAPFEKGSVFPRESVGVFRLLVTSLPTNPIRKLELTNTVDVTGTEVVQRRFPADGSNFHMEGRHCSREDKAPDEMPASQGFTINPESISVHYASRTIDSMGEAWVSARGPISFSLSAWAKAACIPSGVREGELLHLFNTDIHYFATYTESRQVTHAENKVVNLLAPPRNGLYWGDSISEPVSRGRWHLRIELWNGMVLETSQTDSSNQLIRVSDEGENIKIQLVSPSRVADIS